MIDWFMGGKSKGKQSPDPFNSLFPKRKSISPIIPMMGSSSMFPKIKKQRLIPKFKKQRSIIPMIGMSQHSFLKRTSGMKQRFTDHDRDGVISGLDCFPFDKKRHDYNPQIIKNPTSSDFQRLKKDLSMNIQMHQ